MSSGSCRSTPGIRRALAPTGTLSTEIGNSMFYSKSGPIKQLYTSTTSLDSCQIQMKENDNPHGIDTRTSTVAPRFPKLQECAHFHYDRVELDKILVSMYEEATVGATCGHLSSIITNLNEDCPKSIYHGIEEDGQDYFMTLSVSSNGKTWLIRRTYRNLRKFDRQLHKCVHDRKFSQLVALSKLDFDSISPEHLEVVKADLTLYLDRFSQLAGNFIYCAPVLNWLELDNRGYRLIASDDSAINTPAVAACKVVKRYVQQAGDELTLEVGDMISVIDCPPCEESMWWRGKKEWEVGFFPSDCVEVIGGGKTPSTPQSTRAPVLRKRGKLIAFFRSFLSSRPSRRRLKESGILKERVYACDLGEHLLNTTQQVPAVLVHCATYIEEHGTVDGIYRLSGITSNIQKLRLEFDAEKVPNLCEEIYMQDIHSVASVLKLYFRELPNPLLTYQLYDQFIQAVQAADEMRLLRIHHVVNQLPPPHFRTLEFLMRHLARIASSADRTGMNSKNLAIVWAPNLLRSSETESGVEALRGVGVCAIAVEYLIKYADLIFSNRLQTSSLLTRSGNIAKNSRPKSLAVSTPARLLSLDEARALSRPNLDQTFIEVGAGPENLPKYHTVIDIPSRNKRRNNQKSPSTWRNLFNSKNRKQSWPSRSPLTIDNPLAAFQAGTLSSNSLDHSPGSIKRRKLRLVQSAESLSISHSRPFMDFARQLNRTEAAVLRTPITLRRSQNTPHNRSLSHDSYFDEVLDASLPQTVIDVIKTIPYPMTESGVLVKLSFDEKAEIVAERDQVEQPHEKRQSGLFSFRNSKPKCAVSYVVPVQIHSESSIGRHRRTHRTLSPKFLRKHRPHPSGIKRSLSASPKAVPHLVESFSPASTGSSSPGLILIRKDSTTGRKSFRRSTSEDDLVVLPVMPASLEDSLHQSVMDVSSHEDAKTTFESTEMELFDEICAEIYGKERDGEREQSPPPIEESNSSAPVKFDSLQDIAEICEEEEYLRNTRSPQASWDMCGASVVSLDRLLDDKTRLSSLSSLRLDSFFATSRSSTSTPSNYFFNCDSRPISLSSVAASDDVLSHSVPILKSSRAYYFGAVDLADSAVPKIPADDASIDVSRLKATYFGLLDVSTLQTNSASDESTQFQSDEGNHQPKILSSLSHNGHVADGFHQVQISHSQPMGTDVPISITKLSLDGESDCSFKPPTNSCYDTPDIPSIDSLTIEKEILLLLPFSSEAVILPESSVQDNWFPKIPSVPIVVNDKTFIVSGEDYQPISESPVAHEILDINDPYLQPPNTALFGYVSDAPKILPAIKLEDSQPPSHSISHALLPTRKLDFEDATSSSSVEYMVLLRKPCPDSETAVLLKEHSDFGNNSQESLPSVRQLRCRFETSSSFSDCILDNDGIVPAGDTEAAVSRSETLKEKLHALSDLYREASPPISSLDGPEFLAHLVKVVPSQERRIEGDDFKTTSQSRPIESSEVNCQTTRAFVRSKVTSSPVLPEKPRHLRSAVVVSSSVNSTKRDKSMLSAEKAISTVCASQPASLIVTLPTELSTAKLNKVSQMRQMYETGNSNTIAPYMEPERRPRKGSNSLPRPHSSTYQQILSPE